MILQINVSHEGLGVILIQMDSEGKGKAVACASKSLTPAEAWCVNIEQEMLAMDFGSMRFHHYLYG